MAELLAPPSWDGPVNESERVLMNYLVKELPRDFLLIPNVELLHQNHRTGKFAPLEYDFVLIAPHQIFAIEAKDWRGRIEGNDQAWFLNGREKRPLHKTLGWKCKVLASRLKEVDPVWGKAWVGPVVVIANQSHTLSLDPGSRSGQATFGIDQGLVLHLRGYEGRVDDPDRIRPYMRDMANHLLGKAKHRQRTHVLDFEILEVLEQTDRYVELLCRPDRRHTTVRKRVREYSLSLHGMAPQQREREIAKIQNQYEAITKIGRHPYILPMEFRFDREQHTFYEITDYLEQNSLRAELMRSTFTLAEKLKFVQNIGEALEKVHAAGVLHRDLSPESIYLSQGFALLANFGRSYFRADEVHERNYTVMPSLREELLTPYSAFELAENDEGLHSDLYSLGVIIYELFTGKLPLETPRELDQLGGELPASRLPTALDPSLPAWLDELVMRTIRLDPADRFGSVSDLLAFLAEKSQVRQPRPEASSQRSRREERFEVKEGERDGGFYFEERLGEGGYSEVWRVRHLIQDRSYAVKVYNPSVSVESVIDEFQALDQLDHPSIVRYVTSGTLSNQQFYTQMELVRGETLRGYAQGEKQLPLFRVQQVGEQIGSALAYLHGRNLLHRDLKPHNLIFDEEGDRFVLIDFNVATLEADDQEHVGTGPYIPPDLVRGLEVDWNPSADLFALGVVLYELVCHCHPWARQSPRLTEPPRHPLELPQPPQISAALADLLFKAVQPRQADRFSRAEDWLSAWQGLEEMYAPSAPVEVAPAKVPEDTSTFVRNLVQAFSQSRHSNVGTRGLDTFARSTYVPTRLDQALLPAVLDGKFRLVIITGNAGDGKTAFIQQLEQEADEVQPYANKNGAAFMIRGVPFRSNYDGSQDEGERANDAVLDDFFAPFMDRSDFARAPEGRVIAINEGRLVEYLMNQPRLKELYQEVDRFFDQSGAVELTPGLSIINLNLRSVVAEDEKGSIFRRQVQRIVDPQHWQGCDGCAVKEHCFIRQNAATLSDPAGGKTVLARMETLLQAVHLRNELHITMRDLRSLIAFWITRDYTCEEVAERTWDDPLELLRHYYFNLSDSEAEDVGNQDRLIRLLRQVDVGQTALPGADRDLYFAPLAERHFLDFESRRLKLFQLLEANKLAPTPQEQTPELNQQVRRYHHLLRRYHYFEGRRDGRSVARLPYHSFTRFRNFLEKREVPKELDRLKGEIARAFALYEGCQDEYLVSQYLILRTGSRDPRASSFRLIPLDDFEIVPDEKPALATYVEYRPFQLIFKHKNPLYHYIRLEITLDIYELIYFIGKGFSPSLNDLRGHFVELDIFKNLLSNLPYREVVLTDDDQTFYRVSVNDDQVLVFDELSR